ncbi:unnamed protein product [Amoebophrya sp. A120]|nr:unnamed protein product [Amoebophrya sp. A120]|eukprot:GSA120T00006683001.1
MRGLASSTLSGMVTVAYEPYSMEGDGYLVAAQDNAEKLREKLKNDRRQKAQDRALKAHRKNLMRKAKKNLAKLNMLEEPKVPDDAPPEAAEQLKKAFNMRVGFGALSSSSEDEDDTKWVHDEDERKRRIQEMIHQGNLADKKGLKVMLMICEEFDKRRRRKEEMLRRIREDMNTVRKDVVKKDAEEEFLKATFKPNLQQSADVLTRPFTAMATLNTKEARYAKACKENKILPRGPEVDYDGFAFLQDKQLVSAEFADNEHTNKWKTLRIGGSVHWVTVLNVLASRPWSNLTTLEIWGNLEGDRTFGVMALQALFQSGGKNLQRYKNEHNTYVLSSDGSKLHPPDLRNMIRHHAPGDDFSFSWKGKLGDQSRAGVDRSLLPTNVEEFPDSADALHLSGVVNMPRRAADAFHGPSIDIPMIAGDAKSTLALTKTLPLLNAKRSSDMHMQNEKHERRVTSLASLVAQNHTAVPGEGNINTGDITTSAVGSAPHQQVMLFYPETKASGLSTPSRGSSSPKQSPTSPLSPKGVAFRGRNPTSSSRVGSQSGFFSTRNPQGRRSSLQESGIFYSGVSSMDDFDDDDFEAILEKQSEVLRGTSRPSSAQRRSRPSTAGSVMMNKRSPTKSKVNASEKHGGATLRSFGSFMRSMNSAADLLAEDEGADLEALAKQKAAENNLAELPNHVLHDLLEHHLHEIGEVEDRESQLYPVTATQSTARLELRKFITAQLDLSRGMVPFPVHMQCLSLRGTKLFAVPHESFFTSVEKLPLLEELDLADTCLGYLRHAHDGAGVTAVVRDSLMKLRKLDLSHNLLHEDLFDLGDALRRNEFESLRELSLSHVESIDIDNVGVPFVLECLRENEQLEVLDVSHCNCTAKTIFILEQTLLSTKSSINTVYCQFNPMGVEGIQSMNRALCYAEPNIYDPKTAKSYKPTVLKDIAIDYTNLRMTPRVATEGVERSTFRLPLDSLRNTGFTCISEAPSYNNSDPSRSQYTLHLTRSSYDRCLLRALLFREASGYKQGQVTFLPGGNCREFGQIFSNFGSLPAVKPRLLSGSQTVLRPVYLDNLLEFHEGFFERVPQPPPLKLNLTDSPRSQSPRGGSKSPRSKSKVKYTVCKFAYAETEQMLDVNNPKTKKPRQHHEVLKYFLEKNKIYAPLVKFVAVSQMLRKFVDARPTERQMFLQSLSKEFIFSIAQVRYVIQNFPPWERFQAVQELAGAVKMDETMNQSFISYTHAKLYNFISAPGPRLALKAKFITYVRFNPMNPSGRYILDLNKNGDVQVFQRLVILAAWEKKILQSHNCPDFAQHGDLQLMRNVFVDGREHFVLAGGGILMNRKSKEKISVGALLASAGGGSSGGGASGEEEKGLELKLDYYSPLHPLKKDRTIVHSAVMDSLCYMLETEKHLPKVIPMTSKKHHHQHRPKKPHLSVGSAKSSMAMTQDALSDATPTKAAAKQAGFAKAKSPTSSSTPGAGTSTSSPVRPALKKAGGGEKAAETPATPEQPASSTGVQKRAAFAKLHDDHYGRNNRHHGKHHHKKHVHVDIPGLDAPQEEHPLREIPLASRALALTAISDRLILSYEDFVRILLVFQEEQPKDCSAHFGENFVEEDLITRLTGGFTTAEDGIARILQDRVVAHDLTKYHTRADVFVRLFSRCTDLERVTSVECLYSNLLFDVFAMYQVSYRLGRLVCHDWINLDNRYAKSKIENPAEVEKQNKILNTKVIFRQDNYQQVVERIQFMKDKVDISNFQSTFHLFDLEVEEDWRLALEMFRLGDAETTKYQTVILQDMKWSGGIDKEDAMYNPPRGWYIQGPPKKGCASLKYFIPWGVVKHVETYKKRRGVGMKLTNRALYMDLTDENLPQPPGQRGGGSPT